MGLRYHAPIPARTPAGPLASNRSVTSRRHFLLILPVILLCVSGQSSPQTAWLAGAAQALGGEPALRSLAAVELSGISVWRQREQSERPEGPWVATFADFTDVRNFRADAVTRTQRVRGYSTPDWVDNKDWTPETTMLVVAGAGLQRANGTLAPTAVPWDLGALPLGLSPERVVLAALDAKDTHAEPDEKLDG